MEELLETFHSNDQQTNGDMYIDSDEETATHRNKTTPHRSTNRAAINHYQATITKYVKFTFVSVPDEKVNTKEGEEVNFLESFRCQRGVLLGIYLLGVDLDNYLIMGLFEHNEIEAIYTLLNV